MGLWRWSRGGSSLESGVSCDAKSLAQRLASIRGAVHLAYHHSLGAIELVRQLFPVWLHLLAVASPGSEELDEARLARVEHQPLEVLLAQLDRAPRREQREESKAHLDVPMRRERGGRSSTKLDDEADGRSNRSGVAMW